MGFRKRHSSYFRNYIYRCEIYICLSVQTIDEEGHSESGIDAPRVKALLKASFILRSTSPVAVLPAYLLNEELVRQSCTFLCPSLFLQIAIFQKILLAPSVIWSTHFFFHSCSNRLPVYALYLTLRLQNPFVLFLLTPNAAIIKSTKSHEVLLIVRCILCS